MKTKILLFLCLSLPAFGQIINPTTSICDASGNCTVSGTLTVSGSLTVGPGYADDGTPAVAFAAKLSGANLVKAATGDQYAHNIVLTTLRASGNFSYTAVPGQEYSCRSQGTTTAGHWFGVSGTTAGAWVDLGAVSTSLAALSQPVYGVVVVGAADGANATCLWTGELAPIQTLLGSFTNPGDVVYCSAVSGGHCTSLSILAGNTTGTSYLTENASGVPAWSGATSGNVIHTVATAAFICATTGNYFSSIENNASANVVGDVIPVSGTAKNLYCTNQTALGFATNVTVYKNGTGDTALTCQIAASGTAGCNDTTHSFSVTAGDNYAFHCAAVGTNANSARYRCGFEITGVN